MAQPGEHDTAATINAETQPDPPNRPTATSSVPHNSSRDQSHGDPSERSPVNAAVPMERTTSADLKEEGEDLRIEAASNRNVILELSLSGIVRWATESWEGVTGIPLETISEKPIADILIDNKTAFDDALIEMRKNDSGSQVVRFSVSDETGNAQSNPDDQNGTPEQEEKVGSAEEGGQDDGSTVDGEPRTRMLDAQGILVYDRASGEESHTMWMIRPAVQREVTIDLPVVLIESLGDGAELLATHLTAIAESGSKDPRKHPHPTPALCRICERQIMPWWFPKHTELCLAEHRAEADLSLATENLTEHRMTIATILDAIENQLRYRPLPRGSDQGFKPIEYKGITIGSSQTSSGPSSASASRSPSVSRNTEANKADPKKDETKNNQGRPRSFTVRRPVQRMVELVLDLCDTALEINTPSMRDRAVPAGESRAQSPESEGRIIQVLQWQSPSSGAVENEPGLAQLCEDTARMARAKADAAIFYRKVIEYSERIRNEYTQLLQQCIDAALEKAHRVAQGDISSSESADDDEADDVEEESCDESNTSKGQATDQERESEQEATPQPVTSPVPRPTSAMALALREATRSVHRSISSSPPPSNMSNRSSSPRAPPTPKSNLGGAPASAGGLNITAQDTRWYTPTDTDTANDSDRGSHKSVPQRTDSPSSEIGTSRLASARERKRTSLHLPRAMSASRTRSPSRGAAPSSAGPTTGGSSGGQPPLSPLRVSKPRMPSNGPENSKSPLMSPALSSSEFCSPTIPAVSLQHRRQSSVSASEASQAPSSPHVSSSAAPQPRIVAPSIRDFEIIKPISKGAFGSVYLSKKKSTGDYYAIKALKKTDMVSKNQVANVKAERAIMMWQGESDFVAKLYWTFPSKDYIFLVMEYLNGGDCASLVRALGTLPEDWAKRYMAEVVLGVEHLHSRGIVHRDLKPDNLLIDQKGHLKLTDFGLSRMGLIGRQKRAARRDSDHLAPDPLKQGHFARSTSMGSSRSASFDYQGTISPGSTPALTPVIPQDHNQPSYFTLGAARRDSQSQSRDPQRSNSIPFSDSGDVDQLSHSLRRMSILDDLSNPSRQSPKTEDEEAADSFPLHKTMSNSSNIPNQQSAQHNTPPQTGILPPQMALYDPDDTNRRFVGTPDYLAPETINGMGQDEMSDWWSLGCILFEFVFGYPPFHADTPEKVFENILARRIDWPDDEDCDVSRECKEIIDKLMALDPNKRLGVNADDKYDNGGHEIRCHSWFADVDWDTVNETEAQFIPAPENPEDTEYFDARGATTQDFSTEFDDQEVSPAPTPSSESAERPHDAISRIRSQTSGKRGLMPLHIPAHVRDSGRSRRLSEPLNSDDFGQFSFKNLPVLERANKDVIQKLRAEAMQAQGRSSQSSKNINNQQAQRSLEGSPVIGAPVKRHDSNSGGKSEMRSGSPSGHAEQVNSPNRANSQASSPLVQFSAGMQHERRKTSSGSSSANSLQPPPPLEISRGTGHLRQGSATSSPNRATKSPLSGEPSVHLSASVPVNPSSPRSRSHTVGSNEGSLGPERTSRHQRYKSQVIEGSPNSSDNDETRQRALRVHRRRQSSRRVSRVSVSDLPVFRPLDVLVCEDHPVSRLVMEKLLEKLRCRAIIVQNGAEAMSYAMSSVKFDIIMMEYKLPQINGADVARMIRETRNPNCHTPVVAVTGYLRELQAPHHFDALIEKPPTRPKLTEILSKLCQWKEPPPGWIPTPSALQGPSSAPPPLSRSDLIRAVDGSPTSTSTSSGFPVIPSSSYRGSSREDSISSISVFNDNGEIRQDLSMPKLERDPWVLQQERTHSQERQPSSTIAQERAMRGTHHVIAALKPQDSAPEGPVSDMPQIREQPSIEMMQVKRQARQTDRADTGEFGDDEDEDLGFALAGSRSPRLRESTSKIYVGNATDNTRTESPEKVGTMTPDVSVSTPPNESNIDGSQSSQRPSALTPPMKFPLRPGGETTTFRLDPDATPTPSSQMSENESDGKGRLALSSSPMDSDPTPRAEKHQPFS